MKTHFWLFYMFGLMLFLTSCASKEDLRPERDCPIEQLLLDQSDYLPNTIFDTINSPIAEEPRESASQSVYYHESWISEIVIRYSSTDRAHEVFTKHKKSIFDPSEVHDSWEKPSILDLNNLSANQHEIACGNVKNFGTRCIMISQYQEYFVMFNMDISSNGVTHELFRDLVLKIDDQMASCLNK